MRLRFLTRALLVLSLASIWLPLQASAQSSRPVRPSISLAHLGRLVELRGSVLPRLAAARRLRPLAPATKLEVVLALRVRDQSGLHRFLESVYDPASPLYHHFLTTAEFAARFAPSAADRSVLRAWLRAHGLRVTSESANGLLIRTSSTASTAATAFGTRLFTYVRGRERFYANATAVRMPRALAGIVLSVTGLDNAGVMRPAGLHVRPARNLVTPQGYGPADLHSAYDMNPLYNAGLAGNDQTIAVAEFADYQQDNISAYDQQFGLPATIPQRIQVPYNNEQAKTGGDGQEEVELDVEVAHAIAPRARLLVYVSPLYKNAGLVQANQMVTDNLSKIISVSWGFPENYIDSGFVSSYDQIMQEAAAQGIGVFVASGDSGAYDAQGWFSKGDPRNSALVVDYPSSDPWVTAVGGTALQISGGNYAGESVWSDTSDGSGSGGGLSTLFGRPDWQTGPGVINSFSNGRRQTPDVAADADPATGYAVYTVSSNRTGWHVVAGTSASSPLWAAYVSLDQQYLRTTIGFFNPTAYALGQKASSFQNSPYHDITAGNNLHYPATAGWDFATGWGSMDGTALLNDIVTMGGPLIDHPSTSGPPVVIPTSGPTGSISFHVYAHWEKAGSKGGPTARGITSSRKKVRVQLGLYFDVTTAPAGLAASANFGIIYRSKTVFSSTTRGNLDATNPTGTYAIQKTFTPTSAGTYTFVGKVSIGGQTISRQATLSVK